MRAIIRGGAPRGARMLNGLSSVNVELTSRCSKSCWMCGRRKIERDYPELVKWGDMDYDMVKEIARQLPDGIVVQFHDNGEPLLYPRLGDALALFKNHVRCLDTNGKLLVDRAGDIINQLDSITISVFENDSEWESQDLVLQEFLRIKGSKPPRVVIRLLGNVDARDYDSYGLIAKRILHNPMGSFDYVKEVTVPEIGICLEALHHLSIKRDGGVAMCVRFDPMREGIIGDLNNQSLDEIWNGLPRKLALAYHIKGDRSKIPLCRKCDYWGIPRG